MTHDSQKTDHSTASPGEWTHHNGNPVYWLAPEFWTPESGLVRLVLDGEEPGRIPPYIWQQRIVEFMKLQGDPRYCTPEEGDRMRRVMRERLGSDTPWRGIPPRNSAMPSHRPASLGCA